MNHITAVLAEGKHYEQEFYEFHRKEDAEQALSIYQSAVKACPNDQEAVKARNSMLKIVERCTEIEAAQKTFYSGQPLTAHEMYVLGRNEFDGFMTAENQKQGMLWIWDAAEHGHIQAKLEIGEYYLLHGSRGSRTVEEGLKFIRDAAEHGSAQAQCKLGRLYSTGIHVDKDSEEAQKWYTLAAENGSSLASAHLRRVYK